MYVCMCVCVCMCVYVYTYVCARALMYAMYVCVPGCIYVCNIRMCACVYLCMYVCMCVCIMYYVCMYVRTHVFICIYSLYCAHFQCPVCYFKAWLYIYVVAADLLVPVYEGIFVFKGNSKFCTSSQGRNFV